MRLNDVSVTIEIWINVMWQIASNDHIRAETIKAGGEILRSEIHNLVDSIRLKGELPGRWKWRILVSFCKKGDETDLSNCRGMSLPSVSSASFTHG
jgi:hypothetical protein